MADVFKNNSSTSKSLNKKRIQLFNGFAQNKHVLNKKCSS